VAWIRWTVPGGPLNGEPSDTQVIAPNPTVDRQWTLVSTEFSLYAIRRPAVAALLVEHETRARTELAALLVDTLAAVGRVSTIPEVDLARMTVALTEGNDIQVLTDAAAGDAGHGDLGWTAVTALIRQFSRPIEVTTVSSQSPQ
jgi:hypothetical protein